MGSRQGLRGENQLSFDIDRAWVGPINGDVVECYQFDPISRIMRVIYQDGQVVDVPNVSIGITSILAAQADPQAYILMLVAQAG